MSPDTFITVTVYPKYLHTFLVKTEITNYKHQITNNIKISISKYQKNKSYHENTKSEKHESFHDLFRGFVLS